MLNLIDVRNSIGERRIEYNKSNSRDILIEMSLLKGAYVAIGGKKWIPLPNRYDQMTEIAYSIFSFKQLTLKSKNIDKAMQNLYSNSTKFHINIDYYTKGNVPETNKQLAELLCNILSDVYTDIVLLSINRVYSFTLEILEGMDD